MMGKFNLNEIKTDPASEQNEKKQTNSNHIFGKVMVDNLFLFCLRKVMIRWSRLKQRENSRHILESLPSY